MKRFILGFIFNV